MDLRFEAQLHYQLLPQGGNIPEPCLPGELRAECQLGPWKVIVEMFFFLLNIEHAEESTTLPGFVEDEDDHCIITRRLNVQSELAVSKGSWEKVGKLWPTG